MGPTLLFRCLHGNTKVLMNEPNLPTNSFATSLIAPSYVIPKLFEKGVSKFISEIWTLNNTK